MVSFIDRVAYEPEKTGHSRDANLLVWRWPSDKLTLGTQLIVNQSQEAIFYKAGQATDTFGPGTHTLAADNLPFIQHLVNLPFGGQTPFTAEVYFINKHVKLDLKWGTADPFRITDPVYKIIVPVRSHGQLGLRVSDARAFVTQIVGTLHDWDTQSLSQYFRGLVIMHAKDTVAQFIEQHSVSVMDITQALEAISGAVRDRIALEFERFGVEVVNFFVTSISVPDDNPSVLKIQEVMASRAELDRLGEDYRVKRTFDSIEKAAENDGGVAGALLAGGLGVGLGVGAANANLGAALSTGDKNEIGESAAPKVGVEDRLSTLKSLLDKGLITDEEFAVKRKIIMDEL